MIEASAPVRICDLGGWTDTWFGGPGRVLNLAVTPGVTVTVQPGAGDDPVVLDVPAFAERYAIVPGESRGARHPLLEAAIDAVPPARPVEIEVRSGVPAGCGAGTSAAVAVALLGALEAVHGRTPEPRAVAAAAHRLEVEGLGAESGIQDQLAAALGAIGYLEVEPYPEATVVTLPAWEVLSVRLTLVSLGRAHDSSALHRRVIAHVRDRGSSAFDRLRAAAVAARDAVQAGDLDGFGAAMVANTEAQADLHPALVGADAHRVIALARDRGAIGWKVNGAGGDGGSVTILSARRAEKEDLEARLAGMDERYRVLPVAISPRGLVVRGTM